VILFLGLVIFLPSADNKIEIQFGKSIEIGRTEHNFGSIASVCEDNERNFYVLDAGAFQICKFSGDGRLIQKFGGKGQGPGDFQSPRLIVFTPQAEIAVLEDMNYVTYFGVRGTFLKRLDLNGRFELTYIGPDRFLAWDWNSEGRQQLMVDGKNKIMMMFRTQPREAFSTTLGDASGRAVMFNYASDVYVPQLLYGYGEGVGLAGISTDYNLTLLNANGEIIGSIQRNIEPIKISNRERNFLKQEIKEFAKARSWPDGVAGVLSKKIPESKAIIKAVRLSPRHIFVFLIPQDIVQEDIAFPVDVFSHHGEYLGSTTLKQIPLFVSERAMYFVESDDSGIDYLRRIDYAVSLK
jgi:hypothetical protein